MRSLESDKVCGHLDIESRILFCQERRKLDRHHALKAAPCMLDPNSAAYIKAELCEYYHRGGEKKNDTTAETNG
jgi:hypothetical protein